METLTRTTEQKGINPNQAAQLAEAGTRIQVKVTFANVDDLSVVNIRDYQFSDFKLAALYLRYIAETEIPENQAYLIG